MGKDEKSDTNFKWDKDATIGCLSVIIIAALIIGGVWFGVTKFNSNKVTLFRLDDIIGKNETSIQKVLGKPVKIISEDNPRQLQYKIKDYKVAVTFADKKLSSMEIIPNDRSKLEFKKDTKSVLKGLGLKPITPTHKKDLYMDWQDTYNVEEIIIYPTTIKTGIFSEDVPEDANIDKIDVFFKDE